MSLDYAEGERERERERENVCEKESENSKRVGARERGRKHAL